MRKAATRSRSTAIFAANVDTSNSAWPRQSWTDSLEPHPVAGMSSSSSSALLTRCVCSDYDYQPGQADTTEGIDAFRICRGVDGYWRDSHIVRDCDRRPRIFGQARRYPYRVAGDDYGLSLIHISEPTRLGMISYAVF